MANAVYPKYKTGLLKTNTNPANKNLDSADGTTGVFCSLIDTGTYTYNATHEFFSSLSGIVGTDQEILTKTVGTVAEGVFDGGDLTYTAVTGASVEALVLYRKNAGANTTWPVIVYLDTGVTGLPVTPNGGNITVTWNASGIFQL
jgi:hypothetical protein